MTSSPSDPTAEDHTVDPDLPLDGRTIAVTASRRVDEQRDFLERRGAEVVTAPAIEMIPTATDDLVREATDRAIAGPVDLAVFTTATGVRMWFDTARTWQLHDDLLGALAGVPLYSRGPKVTGSLRAAGLREHASATSEATPELLAMLRERGVEGKTVVVQSQGAGRGWDPIAGLTDGIREAGGVVIDVPLYRWELTSDLESFDDLIRRTVEGRVDGITFTSPPSAVALLDRAYELGVRERLEEALNGRTLALCVGSVTAAPLVARDIRVSMPDRMRLGSLLRHTADELAG